MGKTLAQMTAEIREVNIEKGWRAPDGGPCPGHTLGDYVALLHSEVSEALEAYRDHRLEDATNWQETILFDGVDLATGAPPKPEGVGSELADVLIRLLDMCDVFGIVVFDMDMELADVAEPTESGPRGSFGDDMTWLHYTISGMWATRNWETASLYPAKVLRTLMAVARTHGIDMTAECERKIAFNRTRAFRHGGRHL